MASRKATPRAGPGAGGPAGSEDGVNIQVILRCRPPTKEEVAGRAPQVVKCNEALREITLNQTLGGKQLGRTYHFDRVSLLEDGNGRRASLERKVALG